MVNKTGIYIHFPYCEKKCPYCDFNSHVAETIPQEQFAVSYIKDFNQHLSLLKNKPNIISIFFGGGTPSLMNPRTAEIIISHICKTLSIHKEDLEITLEANPSSFEVEKFKDFKSAGINRLSIGVQSFVEKDLKALGRVHNTMQAINAITKAKELFDKFSFDLIYARQNQTIKQWKEELTFALKTFTPNHISLYSLTIEKGTKFFSLYNQGKLTIPQNQDEFYETTNEICSKFNLNRYEISNYAKPPHECKHNIIYWQGGQYIGIGPGAHGRINTQNGRAATMNYNSPEKYLNSIEKQGNAIQTLETLDEEKLAWELVSTSLRTTYGFKITPSVEQFLDVSKILTLTKEGVITHHGNKITPTPKGLSLCDAITKFIFKA